jgi:hypothetical protein
VDVEFNGLALHIAPLLVVNLYFQSLTQSTCLATLLPNPVVSLTVPNFFVATENEQKAQEHAPGHRRMQQGN